MSIQVSRLPLQRLVHALPKTLRRIQLVRLLGSLTGSPYQRMTFRQGELVGNVRDANFASYLVRGEFADYGYFDLARRLLQAGDVHLDTGANFGFHTFGLLNLPIGSTLRHVMIDANPDCVACLRESVKLHPGASLEVIHAAATEQPGELRFSFLPSASGSGRLGGSAGREEVEVIVPAVPLDTLCEERGIDRIGLMKMDIEGAETGAMRGFSRMLSSHAVNFVYFEVNPEGLALQGSDPEALFAEFARHGYRLFWPHAEVDFILHTYGRHNAEAADLRRFVVHGSEPHTVTEFDHGRYRKGDFTQCDLLAVSPQCRVEAVPAGGG